MNIIFRKSILPKLRSVLYDRRNGRDLWTLTRKMQDQNGLQHQLPTELLLLQQGAYAGDVWSMCELARNYYYHGGDLFLPHALSWWAKAAKQKDQGALSDLASLPIYQRILAYRGMESEYANMELKCAMLTEWFLTDLGKADWNTMSMQEKGQRAARLVKAVCPILRISTVKVEVVPGLWCQGGYADGTANPNGTLQLRAEMVDNYQRLIEVIFHELGHFATFAMWDESPASVQLRRVYGITRQRAEAWKTGAMGYEVPISEEDPDTLSYGVYTQWAVLFAV